ncbi:unnamed protein product [Adineta steineri]|uniref:Uncharacterized protein n=1 Tax=Adineta steineri TaxID=433720 RepID=A0A815QXM5_9BILA|nr:unnamed protein product [Adineta steineri]
MAALIQTVEIGFIIYQKYLEGNDLRPNFLYQLLTNESEPFQIRKEVILHAIDLVSCNMRQFRLLSDSTDAPKPSALGRQVVIVAPDNQTNDKNNQSSIEHSRIKQKKSSYQIRMAKSYIADHLQQSYINDKQLAFTVELCERHDDLVRVPFQSRHSNRKKYIATIQFNEQDEKPITEWYCTCFVGGGEVTTKLLNAINNSMTFSDQEDNSANDDGYFGAFAMTTSVNNDDDLD